MVEALLDAGMGVDTRGWSSCTPLDQAAMHGRAGTVRLLVERGADLHDGAFDDDGPTPLDCALWAVRGLSCINVPWRRASGFSRQRGSLEVAAAGCGPTPGPRSCARSAPRPQ